MAPWCTDLVRGSYYFSFFFLFFLFNLKLPIILFSYFVMQFNTKTFEKKNYDLIRRLFNIIDHYMNELALKEPFIVSISVSTSLLPFVWHFGVYVGV